MLNDERNPRLDLISTIVLGILSLLFFWVPLLAPLIQFASLIQSVRSARRGLIPTWSLVIGIGGAVLGFGLYLAIELLWIA